MPDSWTTADHDANSNSNSPDVQITPTILWGQSVTTDLKTSLDTIDSDDDDIIQKDEWVAAKGQGNNNPINSAFTYGGSWWNEEYGTYDSSGKFTALENQSTAPDSSSLSLEIQFKGMGQSDKLYGSDFFNEKIIGRAGDDFMWGRGEQATDSDRASETGDSVIYYGDMSRYTISNLQTDVNTAGSNSTWDNTGISTSDWTAWLTANNLPSSTAPTYFTVTDSLTKEFGGDGVDTLIDIEKIEFADQTYFLTIRNFERPGYEGVMEKEFLGTSGRDDFSTYSDDSKTGAATVKIKNVAQLADKTVTVQKNAESAITFTAKASGASGDEFNIDSSSVSNTAANLAKAINAKDSFTAWSDGDIVYITAGSGKVKANSNDVGKMETAKVKDIKFQFQGETGNDLIVGGVEFQGENVSNIVNIGDRAMYDGKQQNYKISSKELEFNLSGKSKITVQDSANIRADETITIQKNAETAITFTAKASGASGTQFDIHSSASTTATNLASAINAHSDFTASATGNVVTIAVTGGGTVTVLPVKASSSAPVVVIVEELNALTVVFMDTSSE